MENVPSNFLREFTLENLLVLSSVFLKNSNGHLDQSESSGDGMKSDPGYFVKVDPTRFLEELNVV